MTEGCFDRPFEEASEASPTTLALATTRSIELAAVPTRREHDLLGEAEIPADVYWGIHTLRAVENFPITGVPVGHFPELVRALALVKQAAARANRRLGHLASGKAEAIDRACGLIIKDKRFLDQFVVDAVQGGAGTSTNMNANEVIANVALELIGRPRGDYGALHPIDDVNMAQSTNDAYPSALRLAVIFATESLVHALQDLAFAFKAKAVEFGDVLKIGRTQLQDAVPMTLGQEFDAFHVTIKEDVDRLQEAAALFREINLGATAIGTGINTDPRYASLAVAELARLSGQRLTLAANLIEATSDMGAFVLFSGVLKRIAVKLSKICNDLRLLSSGPRAGLGEIRLPAVQAGSSIMPGKVNPVIPEVVSQVAYLVIGHDLTVTMCAEGGQLQLNAFEPTIGYAILTSLRMLTAAIETLDQRCVVGIEADRERCLELVENSIGLVTALGPMLGYETCSHIARRALREGRKVADIVLEEGLMTEAQLGDLLGVENMTQPSPRKASPVFEPKH
ncbi:aspartate ammonia-lyase [Methylocella tundrae]|uniref:Aspartate ammonia-lyase n=1 Tax=Methylocella tundrae TaxID=227605 RepID=A0A4U8YVG9_METTU|nr:aspartate ammonia-lyase [Methylocella tundrae]WPP05408.1 aspartate ammonia-lyase [Methylocella tundrae]VFU07790.1 aspartate ammonia-lyase [Methylocella tundrae]